MLAPNELVATGPSTPSAAAVSRVVVVLPLVPDTSAIARPVARWASRSGSILRPIQPPMTEPSPRPAARESAAAVRDTELATLARRGIFASVTRARLPDRPPHQIAADGEPFGRGVRAGGRFARHRTESIYVGKRTTPGGRV